MEVNDKIWWVEHQIRQLVYGRGMRPGKAIRRLYPELVDSAVQSLVGAWHADEFGVTIGDTKALFVAAYDEVSSCMRGQGDMCHAAYTPHGVQLAVMVRDSRIVARSLVWESPEGPAFVRCYGAEWHRLQAVLELAGFRAATLAHMSGKIVVRAWCDVRETMRWEERRTSCSPEQKAALEAKGFKKVPYSSEWFTEYYRERRATVTRRVQMDVFRPYVDLSAEGRNNGD